MNILDQFPTDTLSVPQEAALFDARFRAWQKAPETADLPANVTTLIMHAMREALLYGRAVCKSKIEDGEIISIVYDVVLRAARRWDPVKYPSRFFSLCKPGVRGYLASSWKEKNAIAGVTGSDIVHGDARETDDDVNTPEHEIEEANFGLIFTHEEWAHARTVIARVCTSRERAILDLAYEGGFNFQEISDKLACTRSAIQRSHQIALRKIRVRLLNEGRLHS